MNVSRADRRALAGLWGVAVGGLVGALGVMLAGSAFAVRADADPQSAVLEATHVPALLTAAGEPVELRYDAYCIADEEAEESCRVSGAVNVRRGEAGPFETIPLRLDPDAHEGRYVARIPRRIADSPAGFTYYALLRDESTGTETTLPAGGATAPQRSLPLADPVTVHLDTHAFGHTRATADRVAAATWGDGPLQVGLEQGRNLTPIGGSAFDVDNSGNVSVLDEAHRRILRWSRSTPAPAVTPLGIAGTLADMSIDDDGTTYVLESTGRAAEGPLLRVFQPDGTARASGPVAERAEQVRLGPAGAVLLQQPSGQWTSATAGGELLSPSSQRRSGRAGRPLRGGGEVVVLRSANEIRVALVRGNGVRLSWRVTSETPLAEVQLAEPIGSELVLVVRVYTDGQDEFEVLVLDADGLAQSFSLDSADWAETAPVSRFRVARSSLYQLGSTPEGIFVDRFGLEVN
jgi:hypothetical protein